jgi:hypothetical protein
LTETELRRLVGGREPSQLSGYLMQLRSNVAYASGTGVMDLRQFVHGVGRHLVAAVVIPDHHTFLTLDDYLVETNQRQMGFSPSSREIADLLLRQHPVSTMLVALAQLNRIRTIPDQVDQLRLAYCLLIAANAALVLDGLSAGADPRHFLARQPILLSMREVILRGGPGVDEPILPPLMTAVMLTHALASDISAQAADGPEVWSGMPADILMEIVCNASFNTYDQMLSKLDKVWRVWAEHGAAAANPPPRKPFLDMAQEALGTDLATVVMLGLALDTNVATWRWPDPVAIKEPLFQDVPVPDHKAFSRHVASDEADLRTDLTACAGPWELLPFELRPVFRLDGHLVVLDREFLQRRITTGLFWTVGEHERTLGGDKAWRTWAAAHGQAVEAAAREQIRAIAPRIPVIGTTDEETTYFTENDLARAYPSKRKGVASKQCDAAIWCGSYWLLVEIVTAELKLPTRQGRQLQAFRDDVERMVMKKIKQLDSTARDLLRDGGASLVGCSPGRVRIRPVLVQGGHFPVHPATIAFIDDRMRKEDRLQDARIERLAIVHMDELEVLEAISERGDDVQRLVDEWQRSERRAGPLKNYLSSRGRSDRPARLSRERLRYILDQLHHRISKAA